MVEQSDDYDAHLSFILCTQHAIDSCKKAYYSCNLFEKPWAINTGCGSPVVGRGNQYTTPTRPAPAPPKREDTSAGNTGDRLLTWPFKPVDGF